MSEEVKNENVEQIDESTTNTAVMTQRQFDSFVKSTVAAFLGAHNLEKITVEDGMGRKGTIKINKNGEYIVQVTSKEVI